jgi:hypothetical protein
VRSFFRSERRSQFWPLTGARHGLDSAALPPAALPAPGVSFPATPAVRAEPCGQKKDCRLLLEPSSLGPSKRTEARTRILLTSEASDTKLRPPNSKEPAGSLGP